MGVACSVGDQASFQILKIFPVHFFCHLRWAESISAPWNWKSAEGKLTFIRALRSARSYLHLRGKIYTMTHWQLEESQTNSFYTCTEHIESTVFMTIGEIVAAFYISPESPDSPMIIFVLVSPDLPELPDSPESTETSESLYSPESKDSRITRACQLDLQNAIFKLD